MPDILRSLKFENQRKEILDKLLDIIKFKDDNSFTLMDLDANLELQNKIMELSPDIKKYYSASSCRGVHDNCKRPCLGIIRFVLKQHGMKLDTVEVNAMADNNKLRRTPKYTIL